VGKNNDPYVYYVSIINVTYERECNDAPNTFMATLDYRKAQTLLSVYSFPSIVLSGIIAGSAFMGLAQTVCNDQMQRFLAATAITAVVELGFYVTAIGVAICVVCPCCTEGFSARVTRGYLEFIVWIKFVDIFFNAAWFIYGLVVLTHFDCVGTTHSMAVVVTTVSIVFTVASCLIWSEALLTIFFPWTWDPRGATRLGDDYGL
jgi:hypothetical protein